MMGWTWKYGWMVHWMHLLLLADLSIKPSYDLAFGQYLPGENGYNFMGSLDAVSFFDYALSAEQILDHLEHSADITSTPESDSGKNGNGSIPESGQGPDHQYQGTGCSSGTDYSSYYTI